MLPAELARQLVEIDQVAAEFQGLVQADDGSPTSIVAQSYCTQRLRELLTDEIMAPIMALQGNPLGFVTDRDKIDTGRRDERGRKIYEKGNGYPLATVRDVTIWALGQAARMTGNEVNILSDRGYLAQAYFLRRLDEALGGDGWRIMPGIPQAMRDARGTVVGAKLVETVKWRSGSEWNVEPLELVIKGDKYTTADGFLGKGLRKAGAWLLSQSTGKRYNDGEIGDAIDVTATSVEDATPAESAASRLEDKVRGEGKPLPDLEYKLADLLEAINIPGPLAFDYFHSLPPDNTLHVDKSLEELDQAARGIIVGNRQHWHDRIGHWHDTQHDKG